MNPALNLRKLGIIGSLAIVGIAALVFIVLRLMTSTIAINAQDGAQIFVRQNGSEQKQIGTGHAVYKTRSSAAVIVEAHAGDSVTQKAVSPRRARTTTVSLELRPLAKTSLFSSGPITYPLVEGGFVYGINPHTGSLTAKPVGTSTALPPSLPLLPALKQIVWFNAAHFIYITRGQGAGEVGALNDPHPSARFIMEAELPDKKGLALIASDGAYLTADYDIEHPTRFAGLRPNSAPAIFASGQDVWLTNLIYKEAKQETTTPKPDKTIVTLFNQKGEQQKDYNLPILEPVTRVVVIDDQTVGLLTTSGLVLLDKQTGKSQTQSFDFGRVNDIVRFGERLILLGDSGLWEYDKAGNVYYKLASYPKGEEYVPESLSVLGKSLIFSTSISHDALRDTSSPARSNVYQVSL